MRLSLREQLSAAGIQGSASAEAENKRHDSDADTSHEEPESSGVTNSTPAPRKQGRTQLKPKSLRKSTLVPKGTVKAIRDSHLSPEEKAQQSKPVYRPRPAMVVCPLCGTRLRRGEMKKHKLSKHAESESGTTSGEVKLPVARFVQGGSPGLRKRS